MILDKFKHKNEKIIHNGFRVKCKLRSCTECYDELIKELEEMKMDKINGYVSFESATHFNDAIDKVIETINKKKEDEDV